MKIKRILLALLVAISSLSLNAQTVVDSQTGDTYEFNRHFYINAQGGVAYTRGEASFGYLISPAAALNIGYNFSPVFGLRVGASGWRAKGSWTEDRHYYRFNFIQGNVDAVFNLTNAICGWKPKRLFNGYAFVGAGFNHGFDNDEAVALLEHGHQLSYVWSPVRNFAVGRLGLGANFRICDWLAFNVEVNANALSDHFNSKNGDNWDWHFNALAGLTFTLGKSYKVTPAPLPAPEPEPVVEPEPEPAPAPAPKPVKEEPKPQPKVAPFQCDVFFALNSSTISKSEMQKVEKLASFLKEYPTANVQITGYADKDTGNERVNMKLSERRAAKVAATLVDLGVDSSRISTSAKGDAVQPFAVNDENRVAICIAEQK